MARNRSTYLFRALRLGALVVGSVLSSCIAVILQGLVHGENMELGRDSDTKVLGNGLLIDPHDQQSIADALIKLVADKQLWAKCGANGLKNIHLFSWTEHCKTYLSRIASCKPMQPRWLKIVDAEHSEPGSANDFLGDMEDELQKLMRNQALRCQVINVIPVSAFRSQALSGDTDYESLPGGVHKYVILMGIGSSTSNQLHANRVYPLSDVTPTESPIIIQTPEACSSADMCCLITTTKRPSGKVLHSQTRGQGLCTFGGDHFRRLWQQHIPKSPQKGVFGGDFSGMVQSIDLNRGTWLRDIETLDHDSPV
ncbi:hypothetical protein Tco_0543925 [Tanacetum coccineum]